MAVKKRKVIRRKIAKKKPVRKINYAKPLMAVLLLLPLAGFGFGFKYQEVTAKETTNKQADVQDIIGFPYIKKYPLTVSSADQPTAIAHVFGEYIGKETAKLLVDKCQMTAVSDSTEGKAKIRLHDGSWLRMDRSIINELAPSISKCAGVLFDLN